MKLYLETIFSTSYHMFNLKIIWTFFLGFNGFESNCQFDFWFFFPIIFSSQLEMENATHFWYIYLKTFTNIYWKPNLNHLYYLHLKKIKFKSWWDYNFQSEKTIWVCWDSFSHTCENVFKSRDILLACFFCHALTLIMSLKLKVVTQF